MNGWLTPEWFEGTRELADARPLPVGLSARLQWEITGGPHGGVSCYQELVDGRLVARARGVVEDPDVTLSVPWADAADLCRGTLDPSVAFMQGRLKVAGSMRVLLILLPQTATEEHRSVTRRIGAVTAF